MFNEILVKYMFNEILVKSNDIYDQLQMIKMLTDYDKFKPLQNPQRARPTSVHNKKN